jgi:hypothetical protein
MNAEAAVDSFAQQKYIAREQLSFSVSLGFDGNGLV